MARPREFDESHVVEAALERFSTHGYAATSIQELCEATGLGKGSLYGAFGDKHDLYLRAFERYCTDTLDGLREALTGTDAQALQRLTTHIQRVATGTAGDTRGCFLANATSELAEQDPSVATSAQTTIDAYEQLLVKNIQQAQSHQDIDPNQDPRALAAMVLTVLRGMEALGKAGKAEPFMRTAADTTIALLTAPAPTRPGDRSAS
jgi:TetR/AcrR family transcriptional regulator, transcriptional repressor for nem operon